MGHGGTCPYNVPMTESMTTAEFAAARGVDVRTVKRWLAANEIIGAVKSTDGTWQIPADAARRMKPAPERAAVETTAARPGQAVTTGGNVPVSPVGMLATLEDAAAVLGTTVGGIHRMGEDGLLHVGKWGPRGSWRVWVAPKG